jgi:hypothetical protein
MQLLDNPPTCLNRKVLFPAHPPLLLLQGALKFSKGLAIKLSKVKVLMLSKGLVLKFWQDQWVLALQQKFVSSVVIQDTLHATAIRTILYNRPRLSTITISLVRKVYG